VRSDNSDATEDLSGLRIGNSYRLTELIGSGATGAVWRALDLARGVEMAIKLLHDDLMHQPKAVTRFVQERAILVMLRHRHIVRVYDLLTVGESLGLAMDLVEGGSLRACLRERLTLPPAEAAMLLSQVADALAEAHRNGVVHRDLKPDNILLDRADGTVEARLTDFGIARLLDNPGLTTSGAMVGTANYLAPETIYGGRAMPPVDVYALGVVLYELLTGRPPYAGGPAWAILRRHVERSPEPVEGMPPAAWRVITACMDRRPGRRPTAEELVTTLRSLARRTAGLPALPPVECPNDDSTTFDPDVTRPPPDASTPDLRFRWRTVSLIALILVLVMIAVGVPGWHLLDGSGRDRSGAPDSARAHRPSGGPSGPGKMAQATPAVSGSAGPASTRPSTGALDVAIGAGGQKVEVVGYGPWQCADTYTWSVGHPVIAKPCHALGGGVRLIGHMQALPGIQADVSVELIDVVSGKVVEGPHECKGLMFTDFAPEHQCGPVETNPPRGRRYVVIEKWRYTGRGILPTGTVRGLEFDW
jgi:serine/threonine-protein kinase